MEKETEELHLNQVFEQFMHTNYSGGQITKGFVLGAMKYGYMLGKKTNYTEEEVENLIYYVCGEVARLQGIILNGNYVDSAYKKFKK